MSVLLEDLGQITLPVQLWLFLLSQYMMMYFPGTPQVYLRDGIFPATSKQSSLVVIWSALPIASLADSFYSEVQISSQSVLVVYQAF